MKNLNFSPKFFFLLSFIEGGVVMAIELMGAKMLAPYFGTSLYVWTTVMAITLGGLAAGYFTGGWVSHKSKSVKTLLIVVLIGAMLVIAMPFSAKILTSFLVHFNFFAALIVSSIIFLMPPVFMMGMVSPLIIDQITSDTKKAGMMSGLIYAVSTVGGIVSTFLTGFIIIPKYGLTVPCIIFGVILGVIPFLILIFRRNVLSILFPIICFVMIRQANAVPAPSSIKILYNEEGLMGQLMVADVPSLVKNKVVYYDRYLFLNRIAQSEISLTKPDSIMLPYMNVMMKVISTHDLKNKQALVLGLGAGVLSAHLLNQGLKVDVCELDKRIVEASRKYFGLPSSISVTIDDARHYIEKCDRKYDYIFFDVFRGEENPEHVFTKECFQKTISLLNENGVLVINGNGYWDGETGLGMRSLAKTLLSVRLQLSVLTFNNDPDERNLIFVASNEKQVTNDTTIINIPFNDQSLCDAFILEDDRPMFSVLNKSANLNWRKGYITTIQVFTKANISIFH